MTPISPRLKAEANALPVTAPMVAEREHFYACSVCGQQVDRRRLGDVIHHEAEDHDKLDEAAD